MTRFTIDRFEGNYAICELEDQTTVSIPKYQLPLGCREGDCLVRDADGMFQPDREENTVRERRILDKMKRLLEKE